MSIMFANRQQPVGAGYLLEFQAGRTLIEPGSTPEKRKAVAQPDQGFIYIKHSQDDQLLHFCWKNRQSNNTELDLIIFPGETEFLRINECKDGRVFMLKFKNSQERHLFWMQEASEDKDDELVKKINDLLSNAPPTRPVPAIAQANRNQIGGFAALNNAIGGNIEDIGALGNMDQNQLMRLFSLMNGGGNAAEILPHLVGPALNSTNLNQAPGMNPLSALISGQANSNKQPGSGGSKEGTPGRDATSARGGGVSAQMLSQIINAIPAASDEQLKRGLPKVELSTMLTRANTQEVVKKYKNELVPHLPDQNVHHDSNTELIQTVGNPQFQQAADFIGQALQTGQMSSALEQFKLNKSVVDAAKKGDLVEFAEKLTAQQIDKQIEHQADQEDNAETAQKKEEEREKEINEARENVQPKRSPRDDDNMDLD